MKTLFIVFAGIFLALFSNSLFDDKASGKIILCDSSSCDGSFESDIILSQVRINLIISLLEMAVTPFMVTEAMIFW